mmetsp:Transcript_71465/g.232228  ORF Transcript_71465/g.232228 Transcript_71465/m.232228 type:complete len:215 (+) Transcript_71465:625-1269(+)
MVPGNHINQRAVIIGLSVVHVHSHTHARATSFRKPCGSVVHGARNRGIRRRTRRRSTSDIHNRSCLRQHLRRALAGASACTCHHSHHARQPLALGCAADSQTVHPRLHCKTPWPRDAGNATGPSLRDASARGGGVYVGSCGRLASQGRTLLLGQLDAFVIASLPEKHQCLSGRLQRSCAVTTQPLSFGSNAQAACSARVVAERHAQRGGIAARC